MLKQTLLEPTDYVLTDGKSFVVYKTPEEATDAQDLAAFNNPGVPIYLLIMASVQCFSKKMVKKINKQEKEFNDFKKKVKEAINDPNQETVGHEELWTELTALAEAQLQEPRSVN